MAYGLTTSKMGNLIYEIMLGPVQHPAGCITLSYLSKKDT